MTLTDTGATNRLSPGLPLALLAATQFLLVLDSAIVNVALPSMQRDLGFSGQGITWVVNAYALIFAGLLLFGGRLADAFGARRIFIGGLALFTVASVGGALAPSATSLVLARAVQGGGAAFTAPAAMALAMILFPAGPARNRALGLMGAAAGLGGASGALLGGILTQNWGWPAILWVNVPIGGAAVIAALRALPSGRPTGMRPRLDLAGALTVTTGLLALVFGLISASEEGWTSSHAVISLAAAVVLLATFAALERRGTDPLVPYSLIRSGSLSGANLAVALSSMAMMPMWFLLTFYFQQVQDLGPIAAGAAVIPTVVMLVLFNSLAHRLIARAGVKVPLVAGSLIAAIGLALQSNLGGPGSPFIGDVLIAQLVTGLGFGVAFIAGMVATTQNVPMERSGVASGIYTTAQQVGGAIGLALLAAMPAQAQAQSSGLTGALSSALLIAASFSVAAAGAAWLFVSPSRPQVERLDAVRR